MYWKLRNFFGGLNEIVYLYRHLFVFLVLVLISLILLQTNPRQQMVFLRKRVIYLSAVFGGWFKPARLFTDPDATIKALHDETTAMYKRNIVLEDAYLENIRLRHLLDFRERFPLSTVPAQIVARDPSPALSSITLNKGAAEGIRLHHNVITPEGLVGQIMEVREHHSVCQILLDRNFRAAAKIQRTRLNGVVHWPGQPNEAGFYGVLKNLDVRLGDVVLTSEYSEYFLPNFRVGVVTSINNEVEGIFKDIRLRTAVDFNTIEEVFVVTDSLKASSSAAGFEKYFFTGE